MSWSMHKARVNLSLDLGYKAVETGQCAMGSNVVPYFPKYASDSMIH